MIAVIMDIPMPKSCCRCPMCHDTIWCRAMKEDRTIPDDIVCERRPEWCPIKKVKGVYREDEKITDLIF